MQLFHLLSHTNGTGGSTLLVDGFYVASLLSTLDPDVYALLSQVPVPAHSAGTSSESPSTMSYLYHPNPKIGYPILNHNKATGELAQVRYNNDDRSVMRHLEPSLVEPWYHALRTWNKALTSPDSEYWVQLTPGTAVGKLIIALCYTWLHKLTAFFFCSHRQSTGAAWSLRFLRRTAYVRRVYWQG